MQSANLTFDFNEQDWIDLFKSLSRKNQERPDQAFFRLAIEKMQTVLGCILNEESIPDETTRWLASRARSLIIYFNVNEEKKQTTMFFFQNITRAGDYLKEVCTENARKKCQENMGEVIVLDPIAEKMREISLSPELASSIRTKKLFQTGQGAYTAKLFADNSRAAENNSEEPPKNPTIIDGKGIQFLDELASVEEAIKLYQKYGFKKFQSEYSLTKVYGHYLNLLMISGLCGMALQ